MPCTLRSQICSMLMHHNQAGQPGSKVMVDTWNSVEVYFFLMLPASCLNCSLSFRYIYSGLRGYFDLTYLNYYHLIVLAMGWLFGFIGCLLPSKNRQFWPTRHMYILCSMLAMIFALYSSLFLQIILLTLGRGGHGVLYGYS